MVCARNSGSPDRPAHDPARQNSGRRASACRGESAQPPGYETVRKRHIDDTDRARQPFGDHTARLLDQRVTGITVSYSHDCLPLFALICQLFRLRAAEAQRFFAYYMQAALRRCFADSKMAIVWRGSIPR